jgi:hypothetical protein
LLTRSPGSHLGPYEILSAHARAIEDLGRALAAASSQMMAWIGRDAIFNSIRSEPCFAALLKKISLNG